MLSSMPRSRLSVSVLTLALVSRVTAQPVWRLPETPLVTIGGTERPEIEFLRIGIVHLQDDGSLLVTNGGSSEILVFDSKGAVRRRLGRSGDGPGEFRRLGWAGVVGDSIVAYDHTHRRVTVFGPDGMPLPTPTLPSGPESPLGLSLAGRSACGAWLATALQSMGRPGQQGPHRDSTLLLLLAPPMDRVAQRVGPFPASTTIRLVLGSGTTAQLVVGTVIFSPALLSGASDSLVFTMDTAAPELVLWDCSGRRRAVLPVPLPERPVPPAVVSVLKQRALEAASIPVQRALAEARYDPANLPNRLPRVRSVFSGWRGELWVEQYEADPLAASTWLVLDRRGNVLARLPSRAGFRPYSAIRDRVAGVFTDSDGVESIRVYQLPR